MYGEGSGWAGFQPGEKCVILRSNTINRYKKGKRQFWEYNPLGNALVLSSFDIMASSLPYYVELIDKFKPVAIQGYPSSLYILSNFLKQEKKKLKGIKCILTSSETLYPLQRKMIEEHFGASIYDHYGHTERNVLIMQCEKKNYHVIPEYGITEFENNLKEDGVKEMVGTGFNNYAMPFIRYKTSDIVVPTGGGCSCGRKFPLINGIRGRIQEYFVDKTGSLVTFIFADIGLWDARDKINAYQYVQNELGKVLLNIDAKSKFIVSEIESVKHTFKKYYSDFDIEIKFVENIPRTKNGKFKYLIQKLPIKL